MYDTRYLNMQHLCAGHFFHSDLGKYPVSKSGLLGSLTHTHTHTGSAMALDSTSRGFGSSLTGLSTLCP